MAHEIGHFDKTGSEGIAHWQMLLRIKTLAEANGWTTLRYLNPVPYTDSTVKRELIMRGEGLAGDDAIFVGFRAYQSVTADYYNLTTAGFIGYVEDNSFEAQPGYAECGVPAHNNRIDYWLVVSARRIVFGLKVGTPVYMHGYTGFFLQWASPGQYPYPMAVGGMFDGPQPIRFSDLSNLSLPYKGGSPSLKMRFNDGLWKNPECYPWNCPYIAGATTQARDTGNNYKPRVITMNDDTPNNYGVFDGVYQISGFNNATENTFTIDTVPYVVLQDASKNSFSDYIALRLD